MGTKIRLVHKMDRQLWSGAEYQRCTNKRCDYSEHVTYYWKKVTCPKCNKLNVRKTLGTPRR